MLERIRWGGTVFSLENTLLARNQQCLLQQCFTTMATCKDVWSSTPTIPQPKHAGTGILGIEVHVIVKLPRLRTTVLQATTFSDHSLPILPCWCSYPSFGSREWEKGDKSKVGPQQSQRESSLSFPQSRHTT